MDILSALTEVQAGIDTAAPLIPLSAQAEAAIQLEQAISRIIKAALSAHKALTGQPYDLSTLTHEDPI